MSKPLSTRVRRTELHPGTYTWGAFGVAGGIWARLRASRRRAIPPESPARVGHLPAVGPVSGPSGLTDLLVDRLGLPRPVAASAANLAVTHFESPLAAELDRIHRPYRDEQDLRL